MNKIFFFLLILCLAAMGCEKNTPIEPTTPTVHTPPKVSAGDRIQLVLPNNSCILSGTVTVGSKIKAYFWEKISGPLSYSIQSPDSLITKVHALQEGTYVFQLTVTDSNGLTGKAAVSVTVSASFPIRTYEYNLDLNINTGYKFYNNVEICPWDCYYADATGIETSAQISAADIVQMWMHEETDSAAHAYSVSYGYTGFRLSNELYASGTSSFDFKKVIQQGGGSFSGTIQLNSSSALRTGREDAFKALPPLTVTGKIDTTTRTVNMQIKGKIIF